MLIFRLWVIMFTQERAPRQTFTHSKSRIKTLKIECEICSKLTIKTPGRLSTLFIVNFEHFHSFFLCSAVDLEFHPLYIWQIFLFKAYFYFKGTFAAIHLSITTIILGDNLQWSSVFKGAVVSFKQALAVIPIFKGIELIRKSNCSHPFINL